MAKPLILLVEDNPIEERLTIRSIQKLDIDVEVVVARDGQQALDFLFCEGEYCDRDGRRMPSFVLLDLKLPKIDGLEVLRYVRERPQTKLLPIVILTSSQEQEDVVDGYGRGANSYVRKPIDSVQLSKIIGQLANYWLGANEPPPYLVTFPK